MKAFVHTFFDAVNINQSLVVAMCSQFNAPEAIFRATCEVFSKVEAQESAYLVSQIDYPPNFAAVLRK
jgi:hypothetical protein